MASQEQVQQMVDAIQALTARVQQAEMRAQQAEASQAASSAIVQELASQRALLQQQTEHMARVLTTQNRPRSLIDNKGLGKPDRFKGQEDQFVNWSKKFANFVSGTFTKGRTVLTKAANTEDDLDETFQVDGVTDEEVAEISRELYTALIATTEDEALDIVSSCADPDTGEENGLLAWRRLHRRWDPATEVRAHTILEGVLNPSRVKLHQVRAAIERREDLMRRYCNLRDDSGQRKTLDKDIRMVGLLKIVPNDVEKHCKMNRARLNTYDKLREEIVSYVENSETKVAAAATGVGGPDAMDVDAWWKGKGREKADKGKGKGRVRG